MTKRIVASTENQDIRSAARMMEEKGVGRLLVLSEDGELKGFLSLGNLTHYLGKDRLAGVVGDQLKGRRFSIGRVLLGITAIGAGYLFLSQRRPEDRGSEIPIHRNVA